MNLQSLRNRPAVVWFTGLPCAGKTTIAERVACELARRKVKVEHLDGDHIRNLFPGTGFTRDERNRHLKRIGYMASLLEKHGVTVIASFVSPYARSRAQIRDLCRRFVEVHVSTPLEVCERRDIKGLYRKARRGQLKHFTGIDDPYEAPRRPDLVLDTSDMTVEEAAGRVVAYLARH